MNVKQRAVEIYQEHIALASTDGRLFRKTVIEQLMEESGCSLAAAATHYNTAKKANPVEGLGRQVIPKPARRTGDNVLKRPDLIPDDECFTVLEVKNGMVERTQSFTTQGDASEQFDSKSECWKDSTWIMIRGLGPNSGIQYSLEEDEEEIKRYEPA